MIREVLVVCVGNICRSPMAAALLRKGLGQKSAVNVTSAGIGALAGFPADELAQELMREDGLDVSDHRAQQLNRMLINSADLILIMESGHKRAIDEIDPTARGKVYRLGEWRDTDIADPYQQPKSVFRDVLALIRQGVDDWVTRLKE